MISTVSLPRTTHSSKLGSIVEQAKIRRHDLTINIYIHIHIRVYMCIYICVCVMYITYFTITWPSLVAYYIQCLYKFFPALRVSMSHATKSILTFLSKIFVCATILPMLFPYACEKILILEQTSLPPLQILYKHWISMGKIIWQLK